MLEQQILPTFSSGKSQETLISDPLQLFIVNTSIVLINFLLYSSYPPIINIWFSLIAKV